VQVTYQMDDDETLEREIRSLAALSGPEFLDTERVILTLTPRAVQGITVVNAVEWLLA